jgi:hypothetical protein
MSHQRDEQMKEVLNNLSIIELEMLDFIWGFFCLNGDWPTEQLFRKRMKDQIGKNSFVNSLENLQGVYLFKTGNGTYEKQYQLTFEGVFVVERECGDFTRILCTYFDYIKKYYNEDPNVGMIKSTDLEHLFSKLELSKLLTYIHLGNLWSRSASGLTFSFKNPEQAWEVGILSSIEELDESPNSESFLEALIIKNIERALKDKNQKASLVNHDALLWPNLYGGVDFISKNRIFQISQIQSEFDCKKICRLLEELNFNYKFGNYYSCGFILRAIIDHVPPFFGYDTFSGVVNNYGTKSFKDSVRRLDETLRKVTDSFLHTRIRKSEVLPESQQVHFQAEMESLLGEMLRIHKERLHDVQEVVNSPTE